MKKKLIACGVTLLLIFVIVSSIMAAQDIKDTEQFLERSETFERLLND